ncbi:hypothetical protein AB0L99_44115 [Streptomyces sp. NPDC051954]
MIARAKYSDRGPVVLVTGARTGIGRATARIAATGDHGHALDCARDVT